MITLLISFINLNKRLFANKGVYNNLNVKVGEIYES